MKNVFPRLCKNIIELIECGLHNMRYKSSAVSRLESCTAGQTMRQLEKALSRTNFVCTAAAAAKIKDKRASNWSSESGINQNMRKIPAGRTLSAALKNLWLFPRREVKKGVSPSSRSYYITHLCYNAYTAYFSRACGCKSCR